MSNEEQIAYWDGEGGVRWSTRADTLDRMLEPFIAPILAAAPFEPGARVLDVGCGAGALSLAAAAKGARALGLDVSRALIAAAQRRAEAAGADAVFELGDASVYSAPEPVDAVVSRYGVMFFAEPTEAFAHIRANARPGAPLAFSCWRSVYDNGWARKPFETLVPFLKSPPPKPEPGAPGPFAFADPDHVRAILEGAGWSEVALEEWRGEVTLPGAGPREAAEFAITVGPASRLLEEQGLPVEPVIDALARAYEADQGPDGAVVAAASAWIVTARA